MNLGQLNLKQLFSTGTKPLQTDEPQTKVVLLQGAIDTYRCIEGYMLSQGIVFCPSTGEQSPASVFIQEDNFEIIFFTYVEPKNGKPLLGYQINTSTENTDILLNRCRLKKINSVDPIREGMSLCEIQNADKTQTALILEFKFFTL